MSRLSRRIIASICFGALLFLQLVVAAYACVTPRQADTEPAALAADTAAHEPCEPNGEGPSKLCEQHCLQASQSVDTQPQSVPASPVLLLIRVAVPPDVHAPAKCDHQRAWLASAVDPPPLVRFGVLRI